MKKKRRGKKYVHPMCEHCPFWLFVLFLAGWSAIALCVIMIFYVSLRAPGQRDMFVGFEENIAKLRDMRVDRAIEMMDAKMGQRIEAVMEEEESGESMPFEKTLTVESCRAIEESDDVVELIRNALGDLEIRMLGERCMLSNGTTLLTFSYNEKVPMSERLFLQQAVGFVNDHAGTISFQNFYCRTSLRGKPPSVVKDSGDLRLACSFSQAGETITNEIILHGAKITKSLDVQRDKTAVGSTDGIIDEVKTLTLADTKEFYRIGTGDVARDYCVHRPDGHLCILRSGKFVLATLGDYDAAPEIIVSDDKTILGEPITGQANISIIGTEGSSADVYHEYAANQDCLEHRIYRINLRTLEQQLLFSSTECSPPTL